MWKRKNSTFKRRVCFFQNHNRKSQKRIKVRHKFKTRLCKLGITMGIEGYTKVRTCVI